MQQLPTVSAPPPVVPIPSVQQSQDESVQAQSVPDQAMQPQLDPFAGSASSLEGILLQQGKLTSDQVQQLKVESVSTGVGVGKLIFEKQLVSEEALTQAKASLYHVPFIKLREIGVPPEALDLLPEGVARKYGMLPFNLDKDHHRLLVAMQDPLDLAAIDFAAQKTGFQIIPHYATPSDVKASIAERYAQSLSSEVSQAVEDSQQYTIKKKQLNDVSSLSNQVVRQAPVTKIVETVLSYSMKSRASDIHIEPQEEKTRVRYRIDGILQERLLLPKSVHEAVVSRIKILSDLKIDEKRVPQDGRFTFVEGNEEADLRVSTLPTINGEKVVMRLLKKNTNVPTLPELGLDGLALSHLQEAIKVPHGIVLVTGPTGSGKTTTLYSLLHQINTPKVNIMTLEDPVEYQMAGVNQVQINTQAGLTFASGLSSFLRQDPNVIMVGEIRDSETAELAVQASLTGHLVFSTLHTSSAAGAIPRLIDMGAEPFLLASSMTLTMAQRIARKIHPEYQESYKPEKEVIEDMKKVLGPLFEAWCKKNNMTEDSIVLKRPSAQRPPDEPEYKGRVGIFEVMRVTEAIGRMILEQKPAVEIEKQAIEQGMLLMKQDGYLKVLNGVTTLEEVVRVAEV